MTKIYFGILDLHGLESFVELKDPEDTSTIVLLKLRAIYNQQRHAHVYIIELKDDEIEIIKENLNNGKCIEAMKELCKNRLNLINHGDIEGPKILSKMLDIDIEYEWLKQL